MKQRLDIHDVSVAYIDEGKGAPFVLVHGAGANRNYWKSLAAELSSAFGNARIVAPDLYGHGETPSWQPTSVRKQAGRTAYAYADDVELLELLTAKIAMPFVLVGHSSGGTVCLEYALRHPDRVSKLVVAEPMLPGILVAADPVLFTEVATAYERAHAAVAAGQHEAAARCLFDYILGDGQWLKLPDGTRSWMIANVACSLAAHSKASLSLRVAADHYRAIACPVLLLHGEHTRAPFRRICEVVAASIAGSRTAIIAGAAHNAPLTHGSEVNAVIRSFL